MKEGEFKRWITDRKKELVSSLKKTSCCDMTELETIAEFFMLVDGAKETFPPILQNRRGDPWVNPEKAAIWFLKYFGE